MLNVNRGKGQADAHLLRLPDGTTIAVDLGQSGDSPGACLEGLLQRGIRHLDLVVLTHYHRDHYGCLMEILDAGITIGRFVHNPPPPEFCARDTPWGCTWGEVSEIVSRITNSRTSVIIPTPGQLLHHDMQGGVETQLEVVCAFDGLHTPIGPTDMNDMSIVCRLVHGTQCALFAGDLNQSLGAYLTANPAYRTEADILKVPHHGTEGCAPNSFFDRVNPRAVLVPAPQGLWLSDRSTRIRDYFLERGIPTFVNGLHGEVTVQIEPNNFSIVTEYI
jgi:competence protein ComEC